MIIIIIMSHNDTPYSILCSMLWKDAANPPILHLSSFISFPMLLSTSQPKAFRHCACFHLRKLLIASQMNGHIRERNLCAKVLIVKHGLTPSRLVEERSEDEDTQRDTYVYWFVRMEAWLGMSAQGVISLTFLISTVNCII